MAGSLFIVTIPTENAEIVFTKKPNKPQSIDSSGFVKFASATKDFQYENLSDAMTVDDNSTLNESPLNRNPLSTGGGANVRNSRRIRQMNATIQEEFDSDQNGNLTAPGVNRTRRPWGSFRGIIRKKGRGNADDCFKNRLLDIPADSTMETIMRELFNKFKIDTAVWQLTHNELYHQISFSVDSDFSHGVILNVLTVWGIGEREGSGVTVVPCTTYSKASKPKATSEDAEEDNASEQKQSAWDQFMKSFRARLNVAKIVQKVKEDASVTFDFLTLVLCAGSLASFGLVENSTILLVSSMLISPLLGPVIATTFGIVIKDKSLIRFGLKNELIGICLSTVIGFIFGMIIGSLDDRFISGNNGVTQEMISRCEFRSVFLGIITALPSGAAVAIAILGENIGSLVGVAITASLLTPAVNAGLLWSLAGLYWWNVEDVSKYFIVIKTNHYSDNQAIELIVYGLISLLLTITNVLCVPLMGVLVLKIKEVAHISGGSQQRFWNHDIKVVRDYNFDDEEFTQKLADEINQLRNEKSVSVDYLRNIGRLQSGSSSDSGRNTLLRQHEHRASIAALEQICARLKYLPQGSVSDMCQHSASVGESLSRAQCDSLGGQVKSAETRRASMPLIETFDAQLIQVDEKTRGPNHRIVERGNERKRLIDPIS